MTNLRMLKRSEVLKIFGFSGSTLDRRIKMGLITPPINLCGRRTAWLESEIVEILELIISGSSSTDIEFLVQRLIQERQPDCSTNSTFNDRSQIK